MAVSPFPRSWGKKASREFNIVERYFVIMNDVPLTGYAVKPGMRATSGVDAGSASRSPNNGWPMWADARSIASPAHRAIR